MIRQRYRLGFDLQGLLLFLLIMLPNFIWFIYPAPDDVLRADSITEEMDRVASVCQVLMVVSLCCVQRREERNVAVKHAFRTASRGRSPLIVSIFICCFLYYACWTGYYFGIVDAGIIMGLTMLPCMAFMLFAIDRRNGVAWIPLTVFTVCHLIYGVVNFIYRGS